ncbi:MAG: DUF4860 domain-containing protein [Clostridiales Family XIII bacterium]|jgi:hypothetical protein|nr:DUF4860 domain-containing protein [Clostridiales Family XIII bacterium]
MGKRRHVVNLMFTITLLGVFALSALSVAVIGAQVYAHSADRLRANFDTRTSLVYIAEKFRQCPGGRYAIEKVGDSDALVLTEQYGGQDYESWIYAHDGKMYELFVKSGNRVSPGDGQQIMTLRSMTMKRDGALLIVTVVNSGGNEESLTLSGRT